MKSFSIPTRFSALCDPAKLYLILALISIVLYVISMSMMNNTLVESDSEETGIHHYTTMGLILKVIFTGLWICILNYLCKYKWGKKIAWFIVLLPFIIIGLIIISTLCAVSVMATQTRKIKKLEDLAGSQPTIQKPTQKFKKPYQVLRQGPSEQVGFTL